VRHRRADDGIVEGGEQQGQLQTDDRPDQLPPTERMEGLAALAGRCFSCHVGVASSIEKGLSSAGEKNARSELVGPERYRLVLVRAAGRGEACGTGGQRPRHQGPHRLAVVRTHVGQELMEAPGDVPPSARTSALPCGASVSRF